MTPPLADQVEGSAGGGGSDSVPGLSATDGRRLRWNAIPVAAADSDDGFGAGARAQLDVLRPGYEPFRASYVVHLFTTTRGYHHHRFRFDLVGLGAEAELRLTGHFAFRAWLNDGYWGIGNGTVRDPSLDGPFDPDDPTRKHYRYRLVQPFSHLTLRWELAGPVLLFGAAEARWSHVEAYPGSLLESERPFGMDGGFALQAGGGVLWDTREPEVSPDRGALLELSGRAVAQPDGTVFGGPFASARGWVSLAEPVVLGGRVMGEHLFGPVPFYEMVHWGGFVPVAGLGGADTVRGMPFGRWRAPGKLVGNLEARVDLFETRLAREPFRGQVVPFADAAVVYGAGHAADAPPPQDPVHPSAGLGLRGIWGETTVGRLDVAVAEDRVAGGGGTGSTPSVGFYLVFDHLF